MKIYCQGEIVSEEAARIPVRDHGFLYGATLFETFRTYDGEPFLLEEHLERLRSGCRAYAIELPSDLLISTSGLRPMIQELLHRNDLRDAVFRYTLSAGEAAAGPPGTSWRSPTEILFIRPLPPIPARPEIDLHVLATSRTEPEVSPRPKSGHYMNSIIALRELRQRAGESGDEGILLTRDGRLSEGTTSNLFVVSQNRILTPSMDCHILRGVARDHVLARARDLGLPTMETDLRLSNLPDADAVFITNSVRGVVPVHQVFDTSGQLICRRDSIHHPFVQKLLAAYRT